MKILVQKSLTLFILCSLMQGNLFGQFANTIKKIEVNASSNLGKIEPTMWGIFFEDINLGADGGIYAELVKNRSFEFYKPLMGWTVLEQPSKEGSVLILNRQGTNLSNPRYLSVKLDHAKKGNLSIINEGFRGMGIKAGVQYDFSVVYNQLTNPIQLHIELVNAKNEIIGQALIEAINTKGEWKKLKTSFIATATEPKAKLKIWFEGDGEINMDMISLFPQDTWKKRPGGMRADMIQLLADLKPGFIRFPGGCIVEGYDLAQRYQWKKTIGPLEERQLIINRWNTEIAHRPTLDYFQTFGLGFFEYFQLAEDIGAAPLPIINCGMACQFNSSELVPIDQLDPYVQDALDLIEFANGDTTSNYGRVRASLGHPASFNLSMMGVGNENWGPQYLERVKIFEKAIKLKYPNFKLVYSSGTDPGGERFESLNTALRKMNADIIDEHYYRKPDWFLNNANRYDLYPRNGSKVFAGEYAAQSEFTVSPNNKNNWLTAISEAAFMTGLERNAAVVSMASYAPLFAHAEGWQWTPDLIWVDNLSAYGTPDYYVQKMFSNNKGNKVVSITLDGKTLIGQDSLYASASLDTVNNELIIKLVNAANKSQATLISLTGVSKIAQQANTFIMQNNLIDMNSFENPEKVAPKAASFNIKGSSFNYEISPYSFHVIKIKLIK